MRFTAHAILAAGLLAGCASGPHLSSGLYSLDMKMTKRGVTKPYDDVSECVVTVEGTNVVVRPKQISETDLVGGIVRTHLTLSVHHQNPDPMILGMKLRIILDGKILRTDFATGTANGYADTNNYITGVWQLRKIGDNEASNQVPSVPGGQGGQGVSPQNTK